MILAALKSIKESAHALSNYTNGMSSLFASGVLNFLRERGRARYYTVQSSDHVAFAGVWSAGYQDCLEDLMYFKELYLDPPEKNANLPRLDYGALSRSVEMGELTEEEANAIRTDTKPDYTSIIKSASPSARHATKPSDPTKSK